jgi:hypothetical protein
VSKSWARRPSCSRLIATSTCLSNTIKGGKEDGQTFAIAVPPDKAEELAKRGFTRVDCAGARVALVEAKAKRDICEVARARDPALNMYFWQRYGLTPEESCNLVGAVRSVATAAM